MRRSYLPVREADLVTWLNDFYQNLSTKPAGFYGASVDAISDYHTTLLRFLAAYEAVTNPVTRTPPNITAKNAAKRTMIKSTRSLVDVIQAWPQMTDEKRRELKISERDKKPVPSPRPASKPVLEIANVDENTIAIRIMQSKTQRRGKPAGVIGATLFSAVAEAAPTNEDEWTFQGNFTKSIETVTLPAATPAGATVWFTATWYNRKAQSGPAAAAIKTNLPGGAPMARKAA